MDLWNGQSILYNSTLSIYINFGIRIVQIQVTYQLLLCKNLLAWDARAMDLAFVLLIKYAFSARRLCCLAFFALLGANLASLSRNASLNLSAMGSSGLSSGEGGSMDLLAAPETAHVLGSISSTIEWSRATLADASAGTCSPRKPMGDGTGLTMIRGHSVAKLIFESSSILGYKTEGMESNAQGGNKIIFVHNKIIFIRTILVRIQSWRTLLDSLIWWNKIPQRAFHRPTYFTKVQHRKTLGSLTKTFIQVDKGKKDNQGAIDYTV